MWQRKPTGEVTNQATGLCLDGAHGVVGQVIYTNGCVLHTGGPSAAIGQLWTFNKDGSILLRAAHTCAAPPATPGGNITTDTCGVAGRTKGVWDNGGGGGGGGGGGTCTASTARVGPDNGIVPHSGEFQLKLQSSGSSPNASAARRLMPLAVPGGAKIEVTAFVAMLRSTVPQDGSPSRHGGASNKSSYHSSQASSATSENNEPLFGFRFNVREVNSSREVMQTSVSDVVSGGAEYTQQTYSWQLHPSTVYVEIAVECVGNITVYVCNTIMNVKLWCR
jgi:hypothetical protein